MTGVELARRAVACPGWRWMPGMRSLAHPYMLEGREFIAPARRWAEGDGFPKDGRLPDLDDPATLGCLLALVREAWGYGVWRLEFVGVEQRGDHSLANALVAALEAAPRREVAPC